MIITKNPALLADDAATGAALESFRAAVSAAVDTAAEACRARFLTPGAGQALVYERKRAEAAAYQAVVAAAGTPVGADYPLMNARARRLSVSLAAVAAEWTARGAAWVAAAAQIEGLREGAKEQIAVAADVPAIRAVAAGISWPAPSA